MHPVSRIIVIIRCSSRSKAFTDTPADRETIRVKGRPGTIKCTFWTQSITFAKPSRAIFVRLALTSGMIPWVHGARCSRQRATRRGGKQTPSRAHWGYFKATRGSDKWQTTRKADERARKGGRRARRRWPVGALRNVRQVFWPTISRRPWDANSKYDRSDAKENRGVESNESEF